ncbi:lactonase family protein [Bombilactobacillus thymidiniphilus]|uniref:Lactonase family protein n=1 Tax=Bombilactobacillus thymidiniphilus TaxID=2923363 RepID=A0ABY4PC64_9LACO|nr:lactonase family protein [Bombilactobacillus thymidiniphilus]UQS83282.1 lactonase family protein [Bombilactobacillus thymidiniphilus]
MQENLLIGGYTRKTSQGIYQLSLNTQTGKLSSAKLAVKLQGPTYFTVSAKNILYTIVQTDKQGGIAAYDINANFKYLGSSLQPADSPAYVEIAEKHKLVFSANFHTGIVTIHKINADQTLTITDQIQLTGHSVRSEQEASHPHMAHLTPDDNLVICDYGTDKITTYSFDDAGKATFLSEFNAPAGAAPRHLIFNPKHPQIAYCICELASLVLVLNYQDGHFKLIDQQTLLPESYSGQNTAAAIRISEDGQYLYTSNRGHNSIVSFKISADGRTLEHLQTVKTKGDFPRDFILDPTENYLLVPHQKSNDVTVLQRNLQTGYLTFQNNDSKVPEGTCIKFY